MLINCVVYEAGKKVSDIAAEDIGPWLKEKDCFVWVALMDPQESELRSFQGHFDLHDLAIEDALHGHQRPKMEEYGSTVFIVMHLLSLAPDDSLSCGEVSVFVGPNFVLSVRNRSRNGFLGVRARCEREPELLAHGSGFVFYALMDAVVDRYFPLMDEIETELDSIEGQIFELGKARRNIERLYNLKQRANTLRHAVSPLLEVASKLHGGRVPGVCMSTQDYFRDVHDHLVRINGAIDAIRDTIATGIQVNLSMVTIEESETTKRLAAWAAIFGASTAMAGMWGMNFKNMPELNWDYGYPMALALIASVSGILWWRFKRLGWL